MVIADGINGWNNEVWKTQFLDMRWTFPHRYTVSPMLPLARRVVYKIFVNGFSNTFILDMTLSIVAIFCVAGCLTA